MASVVIVVDMLRGFLEEGYPLCCGERVIISLSLLNLRDL